VLNAELGELLRNAGESVLRMRSKRECEGEG